jgi:hypothetical protein
MMVIKERMFGEWLRRMAEKYGPDFEVDVRVSNRLLTEKEREKLAILLRKGAVGEIDFDVLANEFEVDDLLDWGFNERELELDGLMFPEFKEYDESIADEVEYHECPECGHKWPK